ncbi:MAG: indole-3-glycerol phosphate synthase TrpC [Fimbriimonadaceae bacterium]|nr:indole-3-glycerol phosphate synthase TrpC [Fimbriimonadaceae bacterium]
MSESNILDRIVAGKRLEVAAAQAARPAAELRGRIADLPPTRDFAGALRQAGTVRLIAELKKASPSAGLIRADFDAGRLAQTYQAAGAAALSVLTDEPWFQGSPQFLRDVRAAVELPLLRKDFVIDPYQLLEARLWGADAALLIVACLPSVAQLADYAGQAGELGLATLVEVHDEAETELAVEAGVPLVGVNNRDLKVMRTDLETTSRLRALVPPSRLLVSESGIRTPADVARLRAVGVDAMLIGEALMREADVAAKTAEMVAAGRGEVV